MAWIVLISYCCYEMLGISQVGARLFTLDCIYLASSNFASTMGDFSALFQGVTNILFEVFGEQIICKAVLSGFNSLDILFFIQHLTFRRNILWHLRRLSKVWVLFSLPIAHGMNYCQTRRTDDMAYFIEGMTYERFNKHQNFSQWIISNAVHLSTRLKNKWFFPKNLFSWSCYYFWLE